MKIAIIEREVFIFSSYKERRGPVVKVPIYFAELVAVIFVCGYPILSWRMYQFDKFDFIDSESQRFTEYALKMLIVYHQRITKVKGNIL